MGELLQQATLDVNDATTKDVLMEWHYNLKYNIGQSCSKCKTAVYKLNRGHQFIRLRLQRSPAVWPDG